MEEDELSIQEIVRQLETAWNSGDSIKFAEPFADDADFIDIRGDHHIGRANIERGHRQVFDTIYKGSRVRYAVEGTRFVRPDVAVVFLRARLDLRDNTTPVPTGARPTLVIANEGGQWQIVAFQNTGMVAAPTTTRDTARH
jgi:uncharacterized protein (TIGR02246 family)